MTDHGQDVIGSFIGLGMVVCATERIVCPACETEQDAEVLRMDGAVWPVLVHDCIQCGHLIQESEWNTVVKEPKP